jgi:hypothetical protein
MLVMVIGAGVGVVVGVGVGVVVGVGVGVVVGGGVVGGGVVVGVMGNAGSEQLYSIFWPGGTLRITFLD